MLMTAVHVVRNLGRNIAIPHLPYANGAGWREENHCMGGHGKHVWTTFSTGSQRRTTDPFESSQGTQDRHCILLHQVMLRKESIWLNSLLRLQEL